MDPLKGKWTNVAAYEKSKDIREIDRLTKHLHMQLYVSLGCKVLQSLWKSQAVSSTIFHLLPLLYAITCFSNYRSHINSLMTASWEDGEELCKAFLEIDNSLISAWQQDNGHDKDN